MTTGQLLLSAWDWEPSVVIGCAALLLAYFIWVRPRILWKSALYTIGVIVLLLALVSPIDALSDNYLFSVHMLQHLLLILVVSPLLIAGIPRVFAEKLVVHPLIGRIEQALSRPVLAWTIAAVTLALWHVPVLYNFALAHEGVHIFQHLTFLVTGVIFWWPVLTPISELRLGVGATVLYLFSATMFNTVFGIILTFAPVGLYPAYLNPNDELGALSLIRNQWGISAAADQQLGGLFMWVPAGLIYLSMIVGVIVKWQYGSENDIFEQEITLSGGRDAC